MTLHTAPHRSVPCRRPAVDDQRVDDQRADELRADEHGAVARCGRPAADDRGSATAEYAVVILAAVAFAGVLVAVMRSGEVQSILTDLVRGALSL